jgi:hypothetical protein
LINALYRKFQKGLMLVASKRFSQTVLRRLKRIEDDRKIAEDEREAMAADVVNVYRDTRPAEGPLKKILGARRRRGFVTLLIIIGIIPLRVFFGWPLEICLAICAVPGFFYWLYIERRHERSKRLPKLRHYD